jgi:hypothetical protein
MPVVTSAGALWPNADQLREIIGWRPYSGDPTWFTGRTDSDVFAGAGTTFHCYDVTCPGPGEIPDVSINPRTAAALLQRYRFEPPITPWVDPPVESGGPPYPTFSVPLTDVDPAPEWAFIWVTLGFNYDGYYTGCRAPDFATPGGCDPDTFTLETPTTTLVEAGGGTFEEPFDGALYGIGPDLGSFDFEGGAVLLPPEQVYFDTDNALTDWPEWVPHPNTGDRRIWRWADIPAAITLSISGQFGSWSDGVLSAVVIPLWNRVRPPSVARLMAVL